jgi:hypothetical protein
LASVLRFANHNFRHPDLPTLPYHAQCEIGEIDDDVGLAQLVRQPPPALHVGDNNVDARIGLATVRLGDSSFVGVEAATTKFC